MDFEAIETGVRRKALAIAARVVANALNCDKSDYSGPTKPCIKCKGPAHYVGRKGKDLLTALGRMHLERAYYLCDTCECGFFERDETLGLKDSSLSPAVIRMIGAAAAMVSFEESSELLLELAGLDVNAKQVERTAEELGCEIAEHERKNVETWIAPAPTMYLGMDGTGVPMRPSEVQGRIGKEPDGSAKTREVKLVTVWSAESRDEEGKPVRDKGSISYSAAIESAACKDTAKEPPEFAQRVVREAQRRGFHKAQRRVIIGDGAPWIWNLADELLSDAIQILDLYHAKEHISIVAKSIYREGSELAEQWAKQRYDELETGKLDSLLVTLKTHAENNKDADKCFQYITTNRHRMDYPKFRAMGLCVGSGVVEAGCKVTVGTRLKRAGMRWTVAGADAIIALRCCKLSGLFETFWEDRAARKTANA